MPYLASFGLGKRHCPVGTAALFAAYRLLGQCIGTFDAGMQEQDTDWALNHADLSPTLSAHMGDNILSFPGRTTTTTTTTRHGGYHL
jgi:hypothetical protein